jgi:glucose uptake protein
LGILWVVFAGFVWGIGNILLVAAVELVGIAIAFPLGIGLSLVIGTSLAYFTNPLATKSPGFLFMGLFIIALAIISNSMAYRIKEA